MGAILRYVGSMTEDTRIPVPTFAAATATLLEVVAESPHATTRHVYLDNLNIPFDLVATWLARLDAPIVTAAQGTYKFNGTKLYNTARLTSLWNRLFTGYTVHGDHTIYDERNIWFAMDNVDDAEAYLVYVLANRLQAANDRGLDWKSAAMRAIKSTRRFLHNKSSGAKVQAMRGDGQGGIIAPSPAHEEMWQNVDSTIARAIANLTTQ